VTEEVAAQATATAQAAAQQAAIQATATAQAAAQQAAVQATATAIAQATAAAREKDSDGDGVPDYLDQCPGAILGTSGDVDQTGCPTRFDPYAGLSFEPGDHGNWYRHFWEGKCKGLGFFSGCRTFEGYWSIAEQAVSDVSSQDRGRLRNRLWALGRKIGYEWARDNDKRCITTEHVFTGDNAWGPRLENSNASNLEQVINAIEKEANYKLEHPPSERHCLSRP